MTVNDAQLSRPDKSVGTKAEGAGDEPLVVLTLMLAEQLCGVPVLGVRDVLADQTIARIPLAPREVAGNLNLRGRIVTAIDLRERLRLPPRPANMPTMSIVTEQGSELYALLVDHVSEVITLDRHAAEANPPTLSALWTDYSRGIYRMDQRLLVVLDVERLLQLHLDPTQQDLAAA